MRVHIVILAGGLLLDLVFADPASLPHPVKFIGKSIAWGEKQWYKKGRKGGIYLITFTLLLTGGSVFLIIFLLDKINPMVGFFARVIFFYLGISFKGLLKESEKIEKHLSKNEIDKAQNSIRSLVSRDTKRMDKEDLIRGTVESLAENTSDGVIAPLLFFLLGGVVGMWIYKAINTLDSMVGYQNKKYSEFGRYPARLDDVANFIPARITGLLISLSFFNPSRILSAFSTMWRYAKNHPSVNAGYPEAAIAGGLGIRLGGINFYRGRKEFRPYLGNSRRTLTPEVIREARIRCSLAVMLLLFLLTIL